MPTGAEWGDGTFECQLVLNGATERLPGGGDLGGGRAEFKKTVCVSVTPGAITLTPTPSGTSSWKVNQTLTILCNGVVGSVENEEQVSCSYTDTVNESLVDLFISGQSDGG